MGLVVRVLRGFRVGLRRGQCGFGCLQRGVRFSQSSLGGIHIGLRVSRRLVGILLSRLGGIQFGLRRIRGRVGSIRIIHLGLSVLHILLGIIVSGLGFGYGRVGLVERILRRIGRLGLAHRRIGGRLICHGGRGHTGHLGQACDGRNGQFLRILHILHFLHPVSRSVMTGAQASPNAPPTLPL